MERSFAQNVSGAILGLAVGDALGVPGEFMNRAELAQQPIRAMRGGGAHGQLPGTWSDDTSMALCLLDSLTECGADSTDQMRRYSAWLLDAKYTARGEVFDVGRATLKAISRFSHGTPAEECGGAGEYECGNGSLMRILPMALYLWAIGKPALTAETAALIHSASRVTHAHPRCMMACGIYCAVALEILGGAGKDRAVQQGVQKALNYYKTDDAFAAVYNDFADLGSMHTRTEDQISGDGYVLHTLQAALWALSVTDSYDDCVLAAVNLGDDTDTTGAVAGGIAGLYYGKASIPTDWLGELAKRDAIEAMCDAFAARYTNA